ncbi:hypothetical protein FA13DRAFT_1750176, partial [Coprinellus micaceus]
MNSRSYLVPALSGGIVLQLVPSMLTIPSYCPLNPDLHPNVLWKHNLLVVWIHGLYLESRPRVVEGDGAVLPVVKVGSNNPAHIPRAPNILAV